MKYNFDKHINRRGTNNAKWDMVADDVISMWVADMDFQSPPAIINKLREMVDHGVFGYPSNDKTGQEVVAKWVLERHGWKVSPDEVVLLPSVVEGFNLATRAIASPGDHLINFTPIYHPILNVAENTGLIQQNFEMILGQDGRYSIDLVHFEDQISQGAKILLFCNPHNPIGKVFKKDELEAIAEICLKNNVIICTDEIHGDLVYEGQKHIPIASLSEAVSKNTITLMAPSKTFNIAGLKASAVIIQDKKLREKFQASTKGLQAWVNSFGYAALVAAYQEGAPWVNELLPYLEGNRDFIYAYVNKQLPGVKMAKTEGTYLAWLDCRAVEIDGNPKDFFSKNARVELVDGKGFGKAGEGFVRLNFGCPRKELEEALLRMKNSLEKI